MPGLTSPSSSSSQAFGLLCWPVGRHFTKCTISSCIARLCVIGNVTNYLIVVLQEAYAEHIGIQAGTVLVTELQLCPMQVCSFLGVCMSVQYVQFYTCILYSRQCVCYTLAHMH